MQKDICISGVDCKEELALLLKKSILKEGQLCK